MDTPPTTPHAPTLPEADALAPNTSKHATPQASIAKAISSWFTNHVSTLLWALAASAVTASAFLLNTPPPTSPKPTAPAIVTSEISFSHGNNVDKGWWGNLMWRKDPEKVFTVKTVQDYSSGELKKTATITCKRANEESSMTKDGEWHIATTPTKAEKLVVK